MIFFYPRIYIPNEEDKDQSAHQMATVESPSCFFIGPCVKGEIRLEIYHFLSRISEKLYRMHQDIGRFKYFLAVRINKS